MSTSSAINTEATAAEQVRRRIHAAAIECVERWGIEKTTLQDIAKAAGCSRQTVYNYFPGKAAVLESALDESGQEFMESLKLLALQFEDPADSLLEVMLYTINRQPTEPYLHILAEPAFFVTFMQQIFGSPVSRQRMGDVIRTCLRNSPELLPDVEEISEVTGRFLMSMLIADDGVQRTDKQLRAFIRRRILPGLVQP